MAAHLYVLSCFKCRTVFVCVCLQVCTKFGVGRAPPPSLFDSLSPSLPPCLPPSLPLSLPTSLPLSLPPFLCPSLPPSLFPHASPFRSAYTGGLTCQDVTNYDLFGTGNCTHPCSCGIETGMCVHLIDSGVCADKLN